MTRKNLIPKSIYHWQITKLRHVPGSFLSFDEFSSAPPSQQSFSRSSHTPFGGSCSDARRLLPSGTAPDAGHQHELWQCGSWASSKRHPGKSGNRTVWGISALSPWASPWWSSSWSFFSSSSSSESSNWITSSWRPQRTAVCPLWCGTADDTFHRLPIWKRKWRRIWYYFLSTRKVMTRCK